MIVNSNDDNDSSNNDDYDIMIGTIIALKVYAIEHNHY